LLIAKVERKPDITMPELADKLDEARGVRVPPRRCRKACWLKCSHKSALMASERARTTGCSWVEVSRLPNVAWDETGAALWCFQ